MPTSTAQFLPARCSAQLPTTVSELRTLKTGVWTYTQTCRQMYTQKDGKLKNIMLSWESHTTNKPDEDIGSGGHDHDVGSATEQSWRRRRQNNRWTQTSTTWCGEDVKSAVLRRSTHHNTEHRQAIKQVPLCYCQMLINFSIHCKLSTICLQHFDAVGWVAGKASSLQKTELWVLAWLSVWSEVQTCIWPSWCHCHSLSLAPVKSRLVLYRLTWVVPVKGR